MSGLGLMQRLAARGHHITCMSTSNVKERLNNFPFDYVQLDRPNDSLWVDFQKNMGLLEKLKRLTERRDKFLQVNEIQDNFLELVEAAQPDLIVCDVELLYQALACIKVKVPIIMAMNWFSFWESKAPPMHRMILPGDGYTGSSLGVKLQWLKLKIQNYKERMRIFLITVGIDQKSILIRFCKQQGLSTRHLEFGIWKLPATMRNLPYMSFTAGELDFPGNSVSKHHYVGPTVDEQRSDKITPETRKSLDTLFAKRKDGSISSIIYATLSTVFVSDREFLHRLVRAFGQQSHWHLVIGIGSSKTLFEEMTLPNTVHIYEWVPQLEVLSHSDCCITHAGSSSYIESIHFGVPMVVYSGGYWDQDGGAARLVYHKLGVQGDKANDDETTLLKHIETALTDTRIHDSVKRFQKIFKDYRDNEVAERFVEAQLNDQVYQK
jgi:zeaxanthin glucosyltransferase